MSYWPPREQGDQENLADALTENLSGTILSGEEASLFDSPAYIYIGNGYGTWRPLWIDTFPIPYSPSNIAHLMALRLRSDSPPKQFRNYALEVQDVHLPSGYSSPNLTGWIFNRLLGGGPWGGPNLPLDLSGYDTLQFSVGGSDRVAGRPVLSGKGLVQIRCTDGNCAEKSFNYTPNRIGGQLEAQTLFLNEFSIAVQPFNWTSIGYLVIMLEISYPYGDSGYRAWIDGGPFFFKETDIWATTFHSYEGTDRTRDLGRRVTVTEPNGAATTYLTPFTVGLPQNGNDVYRIETDNTTGRFEHWEGLYWTKDTPAFDYQPTRDDSFSAIYATLVQTKVTVEAKDANDVVLYKTVKFGGLSPQKTPFNYTVSPGTYQIQIIDTNGFLHWSDGNTNTTRPFTVASSPLTLTAIYAAGTDPGNGSIPINATTIALIAGGLVAAALVIPRIVPKRKERKR